MVEPWSAGNYGVEVKEDLGSGCCARCASSVPKATDNGYARPLDGVIAVVDLHSMEVVRVEDHGVVPLPPEAGNWARQYIENFREAPETAGDCPERRSQFHRGRLSSPLAELVRSGSGSRRAKGWVLHQIRYRDGGRTG